MDRKKLIWLIQGLSLKCSTYSTVQYRYGPERYDVWAITDKSVWLFSNILETYLHFTNCSIKGQNLVDMLTVKVFCNKVWSCVLRGGFINYHQHWLLISQSTLSSNIQWIMVQRGVLITRQHSCNIKRKLSPSQMWGREPTSCCLAHFCV